MYKFTSYGCHQDVSMFDINIESNTNIAFPMLTVLPTSVVLLLTEKYGPWIFENHGADI